jgi:hypothetical protein
VSAKAKAVPPPPPDDEPLAFDLLSAEPDPSADADRLELEPIGAALEPPPAAPAPAPAPPEPKGGIALDAQAVTVQVRGIEEPRKLPGQPAIPIRRGIPLTQKPRVIQERDRRGGAAEPQQPPAHNASAERAEQLYERAKEQLAEGDRKGAIASIERALTFVPDDPRYLAAHRALLGR